GAEERKRMTETAPAAIAKQRNIPAPIAIAQRCAVNAPARLAVAPARANFALAGGALLACLHRRKLGRVGRSLYAAAPGVAAFLFAGRDRPALAGAGAEHDLAGAGGAIFHRRFVGLLLGCLVPAEPDL